MPSGLVIGTAGHIDHGKTSLIGALTGVDTDRLAEEKRRGISIDLGFAHLTLPSGQQLSFVDVPGHERFIRNMLAGAAAIEAVLLVVAGDESVKPQTREHFDICRLLDIRHGVIALTKSDLAEPAQLAKTTQAVRRLTKDSFLADAPIIQVSSVTGAGLDELKKELAKIAAQASRRAKTGFARLPIDRSFALKGFGTVVTGTLWSGELRVGETIRLHPINREARIRGLQRHGESVETAIAGDRTAVNLAGIDHSEIQRGFTLASLGPLEATTTLDVSVEWLQPNKAKEFLLDIGTAELPVTLKRQRENFARLHLSEPVLALPGDRFILRRPSPAMTVAGGVVIDAFPPLRLNRAKTFARLTKLAAATPAERIELLIDESAHGLSREQIARLTGAMPESPAQHFISPRRIEEQQQNLIAWLTDFHSKNPSAAGAPIAQAQQFGSILAGCDAVVIRGDLIALAGHIPQINSELLARMEETFRNAAFQPPTQNEVLAAAGVDSKTARGLLETLIKNGRLIRVSADLIFHADVLAHIRKSLAVHKGRKFSVPDFKSWTNISRKFAIPLLEYLDHQRVTKREGDARVVL